MHYLHTNIVAQDWRRLASFYVQALGCTPVGDAFEVDAPWLGRGMGVPGSRVEGSHVRLPGHGDDGPTIELYSFAPADSRPPPGIRPGLGHLAFAVDDVHAALARVVEAGGAAIGEVVEAERPGGARLRFVYASDPEGNVLELQCVTRPDPT